MGRVDTDPSLNWYQGEIGFFDFYIIPLAKKLKDCGVFGVSSDEYLNYAIQNRQEWESRGEEIVFEMIDRIQNKTNEEKGSMDIECTAGQSTNVNEKPTDLCEQIQFRKYSM
jgi:hypothetical protein